MLGPKQESEKLQVTSSSRSTQTSAVLRAVRFTYRRMQKPGPGAGTSRAHEVTRSLRTAERVFQREAVTNTRSRPQLKVEELEDLAEPSTHSAMYLIYPQTISSRATA